MIKGKVLTILATLLGVTAACSLGVAAYIIIQPGTSSENGVAETEVEAQLAGIEVIDDNGEQKVDNDALPDINVDSGTVWTDSGTDSESEVPEPESVVSEPEPEYQNPGTHGGYLHEVGGCEVLHRARPQPVAETKRETPWPLQLRHLPDVSRYLV